MCKWVEINQVSWKEPCFFEFVSKITDYCSWSLNYYHTCGNSIESCYHLGFKIFVVKESKSFLVKLVIFIEFSLKDEEYSLIIWYINWKIIRGLSKGNIFVSHFIWNMADCSYKLYVISQFFRIMFLLRYIIIGIIYINCSFWF